VLVLIAQIEGNLSGQIRDRLPEGAPSFFFLDIQPNQRDAFTETLSGIATVEDIKTTPMLRGRVTAIDGVPSEEVPPPAEDGWFLRGDRGITYASALPEGSIVVEGEWWDEDYSGPPLVSLTADIGNSYGLELGDTVTVNVLGRDITATITSFRDVDWGSLNMNFVLMFSPGLIERAPHSLLAVARADPSQEELVDRTIGTAFENVSTIRVREAVETANTVLKGIADSLRATAAVTLVAGVLVLAGAIASGNRRRIYESVVLKTLGAKRSGVVTVYLLEYGALGLATALIAAAIGTLGAWAVLSLVMDADWIFVPEAVAIPALGGVVVTLAVGFVGTWQALGQKAAPLLRNE
jgi:putative ABC transport system permease protein